MDPLEEQLWRDHRTTLVYGNVTGAAWWPPVGSTPGIMVASGPDEARAAIGLLEGEIRVN
jgi:hypothetical protein